MVKKGQVISAQKLFVCKRFVDQAESQLCVVISTPETCMHHGNPLPICSLLLESHDATDKICIRNQSIDAQNKAKSQVASYQECVSCTANPSSHAQPYQPPCTAKQKFLTQKGM